jgi:hypothetical protein
MAVQPPFPVRFEDVFPHGAYVLAVEEARDFDKLRDGVPDTQARDKESGERIWTVRVLDADPEARTSELKVKIVAPVQPVAPEATGSIPFRPVEFDGLKVTPYVKEGNGRPRVAYSLRATGMHAPGSAKASPATASSSVSSKPAA